MSRNKRATRGAAACEGFVVVYVIGVPIRTSGDNT